MGLFGFGKSKEEKQREEVKSKVEKLMKAYGDEEIDGDTYMQKMLDLGRSYRNKNNKKKK